MNDNLKLIKFDSQSEIKYFEKIELLKNNSESNDIFFEKIEIILKKLAFFKSTTINNSIYNLESNNESFLTELNVYIKCFIDELQIPLSTIHNGLNLLLTNFINLINLDDSLLEKNINIIINLDKTIEYINNSLIKFINIHNGHIHLNDFEPFSIEFLIIKIETMHNNNFDEKNIKFKYNIDKNVINWFIGDVYNITNIINKLIKNAIKYNNPYREYNNIILNITCSDSILNKKNITITISDTNDHIPLNIKNDLFNSTNKSGLYICKSILELHNGYIEHDYLVIIGNIFTINLELEIYFLDNNNIQSKQKSKFKDNGFGNNILNRSKRLLPLINTKLNKCLNITNNSLLHLFENKTNTLKYNIIIINNISNERIYIYKICKMNKKFNNIYSFVNGLDVICKMYNNLELTDIILIDIDLNNNDILNINGLVTLKILRGINFNKLIFAISDINNVNTINNITDAKFDYIFIKPFDKNKINLLFDFINNNGVNRQLNKIIKIIDQKLEWSYLYEKIENSIIK